MDLHRRLLVIEDDPDILSLYQEILEVRFPRRVDYFADGRAAVELFRRQSTAYDLVITDLRMGTKSGEGIIFDIKYLNPNQRIAVVSGLIGELNVPIDFNVRVYEKPANLMSIIDEALSISSSSKAS